MRATIIYNPKAGRFNVAHLLPAVCSALEKKGWRVKSWEADEESESDLSALTRKACDEGAEAVFVAGGDGSMGAAASILSRRGVTLGTLPCGTGNVWARGLGLVAPAHRWSGALVQAALRQATGLVMNVDVGSCNGQLFLLWAGIGLDGHIVHGIEPRGRVVRYFGRWYYILRGMLLARNWRGTLVRIRGGSTGFDRKLLAAVATNVPAYAGGLAILEPKARAQDGRLALWSFGGDGLADVFAQVTGLLSGRHHGRADVTRVVGPRFVMESDSALPLQLDGEPAGTAKRYDINVLPAALRVFLPLRVGQSGWNYFWN